jgi:SAM-dependent methyltransferase
MVSRQDVIDAYRFILGRAPESEAAVHAHLRASSIAELRRTFLGSAEFKAAQHSIEAGRHYGGAPMQIEIEGPPEQTEQMLCHVQESWRVLGETEPHWSVSTNDQFRADKIGENLEAFYSSGPNDLRDIRAFFNRNSKDVGAVKTAVELGCGVGRATSALARQFLQVVGVDISRPHLEQARQWLDDRQVRNVSLLALERIESLDALPSFEFFYSMIVLQHNPPPVIARLLEEMLGRLAVGGVAMFQVPTYCSGYSFIWSEYLNDHLTPGMEMHVFPQPRIFELFARHRIRPLEVHEDHWTGDPAFISTTFFAEKVGQE